MNASTSVRMLYRADLGCSTNNIVVSVTGDDASFILLGARIGPSQ